MSEIQTIIPIDAEMDPENSEELPDNGPQILPVPEPTPKEPTTGESNLHIKPDMSVFAIHGLGNEIEASKAYSLREEYKESAEKFFTCGKLIIQGIKDGLADAEIRSTLDQSIMEHMGGLSNEMILKLYIFEEKLIERRNNIDSFFNETESDTERFQKLFGKDPKGEIKIHNHRTMIYVRCGDLDDYALIFSGKYDENSEITDSDRQNVSSSGGAFVYGSAIESLQGTITAENSGDRINDEYSRYVKEHEEVHAINRIIMGEGLRCCLEYKLNDALLNGDADAIDFYIGMYLRGRRSKFERKYGNEILAYMNGFSEESATLAGYSNGIFQELTKSERSGGLYDYFFEDLISRAKDTDDKNPYYTELTRMGLPDNKANWSFVYDRTISIMVKEMNEKIEDGIDSWVRLYQRGYSKGEIHFLLSQIPMRRWNKITSRIAELRRLENDEAFYVMGNKDGVTMLESGELVSTLVLINPYDGGYLFLGDDSQIHQSPFNSGEKANELKELNFPYKSPEGWLEVWEKSGGNSSVKQRLPNEFSQQQEMTPLEAWTFLRPFYLEEKAQRGTEALNIAQVFRTYRMISRRSFN